MKLCDFGMSRDSGLNRVVRWDWLGAGESGNENGFGGGGIECGVNSSVLHAFLTRDETNFTHDDKKWKQSLYVFQKSVETELLVRAPTKVTQ